MRGRSVRFELCNISLGYGKYGSMPEAERDVSSAVNKSRKQEALVGCCASGGSFRTSTDYSTQLPCYEMLYMLCNCNCVNCRSKHYCSVRFLLLSQLDQIRSSEYPVRVSYYFKKGPIDRPRGYRTAEQNPCTRLQRKRLYRSLRPLRSFLFLSSASCISVVNGS